MEKYFLNVEESRSLFCENKDEIKPKNCYINIFNISALYPRKFLSGTWKIAYGYASSIDNVYCRHCFILSGNEVIDPTAFSFNRNNEDRSYYLTKVFGSFDEYLDALSSEKNYPALSRYLENEDKEARIWAQQNGFLFIG